MNIERFTTASTPMLPSISREDAVSKNQTRFYTGKPCKKGHLAERYVSNRQCVKCNAVSFRIRDAKKSRNDPRYRLYRNVQRRTGQALRGMLGPTIALGCDASQLQLHISNQFTKGMRWDKYGQWEVDHITPLSAANSNTELVELCHYTNLQPLWKRDNQVKGGA